MRDLTQPDDSPPTTASPAARKTRSAAAKLASMRSSPSPSFPAPVTPDALRISQALDRSEPLGLLRRRLRESNDRFEAIRPVLPAALAAHVRPGPLDDTGWSLLAENGAVAAKLRQWLPRIEQQLADQGYPPSPLRVKHGMVR